MANRRVGLVYDQRMCAHSDPRDPFHPEKPERIVAIADRLTSAGVFDRCVRIDAREARDDELASVHTEQHISLMRRISSNDYGKKDRFWLSKRYNSIYFNEGSSDSALLAAGSVVELCLAVAKGDIEAGAAIIRPPGHHAEADAAMGFCLFNNVAVAAHVLVHSKQDLGIKKVLIVDWDVHHGNGTQNMFWDDKQVLYFSVHRYDNGTFYPLGTDGNYDKVGGDAALGFNVNVPWPHGGFGDADYIAAWDQLLIPIAKEFNPDIILISGGFDSAQGDPLGGCRLTPYGYAEMTRKLMDVTKGRVVLVLEGGYNLNSIAESYLSCIQVLLGDVVSNEEPVAPRAAFLSTWTLLQEVRSMHSKFWSVLNKLSSTFEKMMDEAKLASLEEALAFVDLNDGESTESSSNEDNAIHVNEDHSLTPPGDISALPNTYNQSSMCDTPIDQSGISDTFLSGISRVDIQINLVDEIDKNEIQCIQDPSNEGCSSECKETTVATACSKIEICECTLERQADDVVRKDNNQEVTQNSNGSEVRLDSEEKGHPKPEIALNRKLDLMLPE